MSSDAKQPLALAREVAERFYNLFPSDSFVRWTVAGSIRRKVPQAGDIEFVVIPQFAERDVRQEGEMFAEMRVVNDVWHRLDGLVATGKVKRATYPDGRQRWGEKARGVEFNGFKIEIYSATPDNWGNILAIRTGPDSYSKMLVTNMKRTGRKQKDGFAYDEHDHLQPCPEEEDFFSMCRVRWTDPTRRK